MSNIIVPKYKQVEFVIELHFLNENRGMIFHILGYKETEKSKKNIWKI